MHTDAAIPVTATGSIVGFAHGNNGHHDRHQSIHFHNDGISDKDQGYQAAIDAGERTRDVLSGQRVSDAGNWAGHNATQVAVEKVGAGSILATEKIGAASLLAVEKTTSELRVQAERIRADQAAQVERINLAQALALSDMRLEQQNQACSIEAKLAECCCKLEARILEVESNRVRDDLAQARAEVLALRTTPGNHGL